MQEKGVRLHAIGDLSRLPKRTQKLLQSSLEATAGNTRLNLVLALSYGSRAEIAAAARKIAEKASRGELHPDAVTEDLFNQHLDTAGMPNRTCSSAPPGKCASPTSCCGRSAMRNSM